MSRGMQYPTHREEFSAPQDPLELPVKSMSSNSLVAWSPSAAAPALLAAGVAEGMVDMDFHSPAQLELLHADLSGEGGSFASLGRVAVSSCFSAIAWGGLPSTSLGSRELGIIAGGCVDGGLRLWEASRIASGSDDSLLARSLGTHQGRISAMEFHPSPSRQRFLATAGQDGQVFGWDLEDPTSAKVFQLAQKHTSGVSALSWNRVSEHILATATQAGETHIWDVRAGPQAVLSLRHHSRLSVAATGLAWNPVSFRQIAVSYFHPEGDMWDLRHHKEPLAVLQWAHERGVLSLDWCPHDPELFLTSGEDRSVALWEFKQPGAAGAEDESSSGSAEAPASCQMVFKFRTEHAYSGMKWSPRLPGYVAGPSLHSSVDVFAVPFAGSHANQWLKRPAALATGFGAKVVVAAAAPSAAEAGATDDSGAKVVVAAGAAASTTLTLSRMPVDEEFLVESEKLLEELVACDGDLGAPLCQAQLQDDDAGGGGASSSDPQQQELWSFLHASFAPQAAVEHVQQLGFGAVADPLEQSTAADPVARVQELVLVRHFAQAVQVCMEQGLVAEALVIAQMGPPELYEATRTRFLAEHREEFVRELLSKLVVRDLRAVAAASKLGDWKESLCAILMYADASGGEVRALTTQLGTRLLAAGERHACFVCFICGTSLASLVSASLDSLGKAGGLAGGVHESVRIALALAASIRQRTGGSLAHADARVLATTLCDYAQRMASQGKLEESIQFLQAAQVDAVSQEDKMLVERIRSSDPALGGQQQQQPQRHQQEQPPSRYSKPQRQSSGPGGRSSAVPTAGLTTRAPSKMPPAGGMRQSSAPHQPQPQPSMVGGAPRPAGRGAGPPPQQTRGGIPPPRPSSSHGPPAPANAPAPSRPMRSAPSSFSRQSYGQPPPQRQQHPQQHQPQPPQQQYAAPPRSVAPPPQRGGGYAPAPMRPSPGRAQQHQAPYASRGPSRGFHPGATR